MTRRLFLGSLLALIGLKPKAAAAVSFPFPSKFTFLPYELYLRATRMGFSPINACYYARVTPRQIQNFRTCDPAFREALAEARAEAVRRIEAKLIESES